jgi:hypothetical protein
MSVLFATFVDISAYFKGLLDMEHLYGSSSTPPASVHEPKGRAH